MDEAQLELIDDAVGATLHRHTATTSFRSVMTPSSTGATRRTKIVFCDTSDDEGEVEGGAQSSASVVRCAVTEVVEEYNLTTDHDDLEDEEAAAVAAMSAGLDEDILRPPFGLILEDSRGQQASAAAAMFPLPPLLPLGPSGLAPVRFRTVDISPDDQLQQGTTADRRRTFVPPRCVKNLSEATATRKRFRERDESQTRDRSKSCDGDDDVVVAEEEIVAASNALLSTGGAEGEAGEEVVVLPVRVLGQYKLTLDEADMQEEFEVCDEECDEAVLSGTIEAAASKPKPQTADGQQHDDGHRVGDEATEAVLDSAGDDQWDDEEEDDEEDDELDDLIAVAAIEQMQKCCESFLLDADAAAAATATEQHESSGAAKPTSALAEGEAPVVFTDAREPPPASAEALPDSGGAEPPSTNHPEATAAASAPQQGNYTFTAFRRFLDKSRELLSKYAAKELSADELTHQLARDVFHVQRAFQRLSKPPKDAPIIINGVRMDI